MEQKGLDNEYQNALKLYMSIVDTLLYRETMSQSKLCVWTKDNTCVNFTVMDFKALIKQQGRGLNYRYYMRIFRTFGWIICETEKFSKVQWINGKSTRVISVDYKRYKMLEELVSHNFYFEISEKYINVINKLIYLNDKTKKRLCITSQNEKILKVKGNNFKLLFEKECNEYKTYMRYFRALEWILCDAGKFSTIQKIDGKSTRVISIDFEKYKLMKTLLESG